MLPTPTIVLCRWGVWKQSYVINCKYLQQQSHMLHIAQQQIHLPLAIYGGCRVWIIIYLWNMKLSLKQALPWCPTLSAINSTLWHIHLTQLHKIRAFHSLEKTCNILKGVPNRITVCSCTRGVCTHQPTPTLTCPKTIPSTCLKLTLLGSNG